MKELVNGHKATPVRLIDVGPVVLIDNKIFDLVVALNELGLYTIMSCENNISGRVWIQFAKSDYASNLIALVARNSPKLKNKALLASTQRYDEHPDRWKVRGRWWVDSNVHTHERKDSGLWVAVRTSIRFPRTQLQEITRVVTTERDFRLFG